MNIDGSDARAEDINQRAAVVFKWPYPDESQSDAATTLTTLVREACDRHLSDVMPANYEVSRYEIGPAAAGLFFDLVCTIVRDVRPYMNDAANLIALSAAARAIYKLAGAMVTNRRPYSPAWAPNYEARADEFSAVFSEPMIVGLCFAHFSECYSAGSRVSIDSISRSPDPQFLSASHPGGAERYTVRVWTGQTSYVYLVDGHGGVFEHVKIRGKSLNALPIPNWFDEPDYLAPAPNKRSFYEQSFTAVK